MTMSVATAPSYTIQEDLSSLTYAGDVRLRKIKELYTFRNEAAVRQFMGKNTALMNVLIEAYPYVARFFGELPRIILERFTDPEIRNAERLVAYIQTSLPVDEALECLNALDEGWFLDQFDYVDGLLNFNLEFVDA